MAFVTTTAEDYIRNLSVNGGAKQKAKPLVWKQVTSLALKVAQSRYRKLLRLKREASMK
jgi:hypothetical protein